MNSQAAISGTMPSSAPAAGGRGWRHRKRDRARRETAAAAVTPMNVRYVTQLPTWHMIVAKRTIPAPISP